jgi:hypothetical protein
MHGFESSRIISSREIGSQDILGTPRGEAFGY